MKVLTDISFAEYRVHSLPVHMNTRLAVYTLQLSLPSLPPCSLPSGLRVFLSVLGDDVVPEGGSMEERTVIFVISRDENATLNRSVSVLFSTSDGSALG